LSRESPEYLSEYADENEDKKADQSESSFEEEKEFIVHSKKPPVNDMKSAYFDFESLPSDLIKSFSTYTKDLEGLEKYSPYERACMRCKNLFNMTNRLPRRLKECKGIFCEECLSKPDGFKCNVCEKKHSPDVLDTDAPVDQKIKKRQPSYMKSLNDVCTYKDNIDDCDNVAKYKCLDCKIYMCDSCAHSYSHSNMKHSASIIQFKNIRKFLSRAFVENTDSLSSKVKDIKEAIETLKESKQTAEKEVVPERGNIDHHYSKAQIEFGKNKEGLIKLIKKNNDAAVNELEESEANITSILEDLRTEYDELTKIVKPKIFGSDIQVQDLVSTVYRVDKKIAETKKRWNALFDTSLKTKTVTYQPQTFVFKKDLCEKMLIQIVRMSKKGQQEKKEERGSKNI